MTKPLYIILLLVLLTSCTKGGGNIYVTGKVVNPVTGEGIPNVELSLYRPEVGGTIGNSAGNKIVKTVSTDAAGNYELSHTGGAFTYRLKIKPQVGELYLIGTAPNDFDVPEGNRAFIVDKGTNMEIDFEVVPYAYIKLDIENVNCQPSDTIFYQRFYIDGNESSNGRTMSGCFDYNGDYFDVPMGNYRYEWKITQNGQTTVHDTTFYLEKNGYFTLKITY